MKCIVCSRKAIYIIKEEGQQETYCCEACRLQNIKDVKTPNSGNKIFKIVHSNVDGFREER